MINFKEKSLKSFRKSEKEVFIKTEIQFTVYSDNLLSIPWSF